MAMQRYAPIVMGVRQAGKPLAVNLDATGRRTAVIEREHVGGTCINVGCTPTKTMVASARIAYLARRAADYGIRCGPVGVDLGQVHRRKQAIVDVFRASASKLLQNAVIEKIVADVGKTAAHVCTAWGLQRGAASLTTSTKADHIRESVEVSPLPESAMEEFKGIATPYRFNRVVETGIHGFIPRRR